VREGARANVYKRRLGTQRDRNFRQNFRRRRRKMTSEEKRKRKRKREKGKEHAFKSFCV